MDALKQLFGRIASRRCVLATIAILVAIPLASVPGQAHAQACCTATGGGEFAVVGRCKQAVLAVQTTFEKGIGTFNNQGVYSGLNNVEVDDVVVSFGGGIRLFHPKWQIYGSIPTRFQYRSFAGTSGDLSVGLGDVTSTVRWTALEDNLMGISADDTGTFIPFVDLYLGAKMPTGRAPENTRTATGADITGDGAWQLIVGTKVSKFVTSEHVLELGAAYSHRFARSITTIGGVTDFEDGDELNLRLGYLHIPNLEWSWGLNTSLKLEGKAKTNGAVVPRSQSRRLRFGAHVTWGFDFPYWEATLSGVMDALWDDAGTNLPYVGPAFSLTLRRQFP